MASRPTTEQHQTIWLQRLAPNKPALGSPCNGCGVCCAAAPCPVSILFLWQRRGACRALMWSEEQHIYRCGMAIQPSHYLRYLPVFLETVFIKLIRRWIAADSACDSSAQLTLAGEEDPVQPKENKLD